MVVDIACRLIMEVFEAGSLGAILSRWILAAWHYKTLPDYDDP